MSDDDKPTPAKPRTRKPRTPKANPDGQQQAAKDNVLVLPTASGRAAAEGRRGKRQSNGQQTSPKRIEVAERRARALGLRKAGASFVTIAEAIRKEHEDAGTPIPNYDNRAAHADVRERIEKIESDALTEYVEESNARLDTALMAIYPAVSKGELDAVHAMIAIEKRRANLLGLDAARRVQLSGPDGKPIQLSAVPMMNPAEALEEATIVVNRVLGPPTDQMPALPAGSTG